MIAPIAPIFAGGGSRVDGLPRSALYVKRCTLKVQLDDRIVKFMVGNEIAFIVDPSMLGAA
jgi:hypothetical protein